METFPRWTIRGRGDGPHVLLTAGVHGDEFAPMAAVRALGPRLDAGVLARGRVTVVPTVNVAAARLGRRRGPDGLDLARTCPGRADGSPTERVAADLSALIREADYYVDLHDGGRALDVLPLAGYMLHPDPAVLDAQRRMARAFGLGLIWGTDPSLGGRSLSVARDAGVPAIYVEHGGGGRVVPAVRDDLVRGCLNVLATFGLVDDWAVDPPPARSIEDRRTGSGHMQVQHPAPAAGYFVPQVTLGAEVRRGDPIGTVDDPGGGPDRAIVAERSGLVVVLRAFAAVEAGDCLAVVAEDGGG